MKIYLEGNIWEDTDIRKAIIGNYQVHTTFMINKKEVKTKLRRLPNGYWAVFIDSTLVDTSSPTREAAQAKLNHFLQKMKGAGK